MRPHTHGFTLRAEPGRAKPWGVHWRATLVTGARTRRAKFFATETDARAWIATIEAEATPAAPARPIPPKPPVVTATPAPPGLTVAHRPGLLTFRTFAESWLETITPRRTPSTLRSYRQLMTNHVYPRLGGTRLGTIGPAEVTSVITDCARHGMSWGTQKAVVRVLSSCLRWAVRFQHLPLNPALGLIKDLADANVIDPEPNPLTADQAEAFLGWLQTGIAPARDRAVDDPIERVGRRGRPREAYPEWHPYFLTLLRTGMRRGEAAALQWKTVYLEATPPRARLERSYSPSAVALAATRISGDVQLKTKRPHEIDLAPVVVAALGELARTRKAEALATRRPLSPYVFVTPRGARILSDSATAERVFARGMAALGIASADHTIHDLRDTFATLHLQQDPARLFWVSWMLGHRHTSTTLNRYTRWVPQTAGAQSFAGALDGPLIKPLKSERYTQ
jgi:integrase